MANVARISAAYNNALHQTGRGGAAVFLCRPPVVEARPAGERECCAGLAGIHRAIVGDLTLQC